MAPFPSPALVIKEKKRESLDEFELGDFSLENYECHGKVQMVMKA